MQKGRIAAIIAAVAVAIMVVGVVGLFATRGRSQAAAAPATVAAPARGQPGATAAEGRKPDPWPLPGWVAVPVADVWDHIDSSRPIDAAAVAARPDLAAWVSGMDLAQKLDLDNLLATQALLDEPVTVLGVSGTWAHVLVADQRGAVYRSGIAGWMPFDQIMLQPPAPGPTVTVSVPSVSVAGMDLSYGTELPATGRAGGQVIVSTPWGQGALPASDVRQAPLAPDGKSVVAEAERFVGLPYLWAGTSAFGFDCSGLTYTVYRQFGITLPRDAGDQQSAGSPVARNDLQPGDLVFYSFSGVVDHVGIYAGGGRMIDSPETGKSLEVVPMWGTPLAAHFAGAARYLATAASGSLG